MSWKWSAPGAPPVAAPAARHLNRAAAFGDLSLAGVARDVELGLSAIGLGEAAIGLRALLREEPACSTA